MSQTMDKLAGLAGNLWWSWDAQATALFEGLAPKRWPQVLHNPVALLEDLTPAERNALASNPETQGNVDRVYARFQAWMAQVDTWAAGRDLPRVLYLSMEFGLHESLRIYSGGLGVLAGDHVRSASDLGLDFRGVGLLYSSGYFRQVLDDGKQLAAYPNVDRSRLPITPVLGADGTPIQIPIPDGNREYQARAWRLQVGRVHLYLLDANLPENPPDLREVTRSLYGGDTRMRLRQEILLGIGGVRLLNALGEQVDVVHLNEGHCAFAPMEMLRQAQQEDPSVTHAQIRERVVFTTHTPVPAGHDRFGWEMVNAHLGPWRKRAGWTPGALMDLGRVTPSDLDEPLCMTVLALRMARASNGVSKLHGQVSREMWSKVELEQPIGHITNGVHPTYWMAPAMQEMLDTHRPKWRNHWRDLAFWKEGMASLDDGVLWETRQALKNHLLDQVHAHTGQRLDPQALLIGFARRFAPYKRADLIFSDAERLQAILESGASLVFAGKAHPRDTLGQELLARVVRWSRDPLFKGQVAFLQGYEMQHGRWMTSGSDLWLNTPRRPREASGTSGQKVVLNGGLNCSILDGWWPEAFDGDNGFAIGDTRDWADTQAQDAHDAEVLYTLLENQVLPSFRKKSDWLRRVKHSMATGIPVFNTHRMVAQYAESMYRTQNTVHANNSGHAGSSVRG